MSTTPEPQHPDSASAGSAGPPSPSAPAAAAGTASATGAPSAPEAPTAAGPELPEVEPLTPELVEEEALRGDFMLRCAVALLALLLGCATIGTSSTLVHVKSGQYIADHGWWPPAKDPFSYTAGDRPWRNTEWLFDLTVAKLYGIAGWAGPILLKAVLAAAAVLFLQCVGRTGVSTWWASVATAIALVGAVPWLTVTPDFATFLGLAVTLVLLMEFREHADSKWLWCLPAVFIVWGNFDRRMFLGPLVLVAYGVGDAVGLLVGRTILVPAQRRMLWSVLGVGLVAACVNPFGWHALGAARDLYAVEYPAYRELYAAGRTQALLEYQSLNLQRLRQSTGYAGYAAVLSFVGACAAIWLSRKRLDPGAAALVAVFAALACVSMHELAALALACGAVSTVLSAEWYAANFRQEYTTDAEDLLFSRGGRAATVAALVLLAYLGVTGRIDAWHASNVGLALRGDLAGRIESLQEGLYRTQRSAAERGDGAGAEGGAGTTLPASADEPAERITFDDRPFNFTLRQGDELIWTGMRVFVDGRVGFHALPAADGGESTLRRHLGAVGALRSRQDPERWHAVLDRDPPVTWILPDLQGARADREILEQSIEGTDWKLTSLDGSFAVLHRKVDSVAGLPEFVAEHSVDFVAEAFRKDSPIVTEREDWARPPTFYARYLSSASNLAAREPRAIRQAERYHDLLRTRPRPVPGDPGEQEALAERTALAYLGIRHALVGLVEDPQNSAGYLILGNLYLDLDDTERRILGDAPQDVTSSMRFAQAIGAYHQALLLDPRDRNLHMQLSNVYAVRGRLEAALHHLEAYLQSVEEDVELVAKAGDELMRSRSLRDALRAEVEAARARIGQMQQGGADEFATIRAALEVGCTPTAVEMYEKAQSSLAPRSSADLTMYARALLEVGRSEASYEELRKLKLRTPPQVARTLDEVVAFAALHKGEYSEALSIWVRALRDRELRTRATLLQTLPLVGPPGAQWPLPQTAAVEDALVVAPSELDAKRTYVALCSLEVGLPEQAAKVFRALIDSHPSTPLRPLVRFYLQLLTGETIDETAPSDQIPIRSRADLFEDAAADAGPTPEKTDPAPKEPAGKPDVTDPAKTDPAAQGAKGAAAAPAETKP